MDQGYWSRRIAQLFRGSGLVLAVIAACATAGAARAEAPAVMPLIRISTENTPEHVQTRALRLFAQRLEQRLAGRVQVVVHDNADLFRDRDVIEAVAAGRVEMAAPGIWHLGHHVADFGVFLLPMFYGRAIAANDAIRDGAIGRALAARLEAAVDVVVPGRWIDLGATHIFTAGARLTRPEDLRGLRIRVAGGEGNAARIRTLGARAVVIPWPDLPPALETGQVDGTLTSAGTVVSASLWEYGIDGAYLDRQYFAQYIPIISPQLWGRLPEHARAALFETWDGVVDEARAMAAADQEAAIEILRRNGVTVNEPAEDVLDATRTRLMAAQPAIVRALRLDPALVAAVLHALEAP